MPSFFILLQINPTASPADFTYKTQHVCFQLFPVLQLPSLSKWKKLQKKLQNGISVKTQLCKNPRISHKHLSTCAHCSHFLKLCQSNLTERQSDPVSTSDAEFTFAPSLTLHLCLQICPFLCPLVLKWLWRMVLNLI